MRGLLFSASTRVVVSIWLVWHKTQAERLSPRYMRRSAHSSRKAKKLSIYHARTQRAALAITGMFIFTTTFTRRRARALDAGAWSTRDCEIVEMLIAFPSRTRRDMSGVSFPYIYLIVQKYRSGTRCIPGMTRDIPLSIESLFLPRTSS